MNPLVSVIVVNHNRAGLLRDCLGSLLEQTYQPLEIIVVDNGSSDGSVQVVEDIACPQIRLLRLGSNQGFGTANNLGISEARGEFIALLNNDAVAQPDWIECLMQEAQASGAARTGMWASKILLFDSAVIDKAGHLIYPDGQNRGRGTGQLDRGQCDDRTDALFPDGCAALYRKQAFLEAGGFDPDFFAYADDADLGLRIRLLGWDCTYVPGAAVRHRHSATSGPYSERKIYLVERNRLWLAVKNFPLLLLFANVPFTLNRWFWNLTAAVLQRGSAGNFRRNLSFWTLVRVIVRAYWDGLAGLGPILRRRRETRSHRRLSDSEFWQLLRRFRITARELAFSDVAPEMRTEVASERRGVPAGMPDQQQPGTETPVATSKSAPMRDLVLVFGAGLLIFTCLAGFAAISNGIGPPRIRNLTYVAAALFYLVAVWRSRRLAWTRRLAVAILAVGLACRAVLFFTPDSVEADYYRYLWDGALTAHGISPYLLAPETVKNRQVSDPRVVALAEQGSVAVSRINHPHLRTIYPPVSQLLFAGAYVLKPFNTTAWRFILLGCDLLAFGVLVWLLRWASLPTIWSLVYVWNPLLVVETYHYRHLDATLAAALLLFLTGLAVRKPLLAAFALAAAVGLKLWPLLLAPLLLGRFLGDRRKLTTAAVTFSALCLLIFLPFATAIQLQRNSGAVQYAKTFDANEFAYVPIDKFGWFLTRQGGVPLDGRVIARGLIMLLLATFSLAMARGCRHLGISQLGNRALLVMLLMLLVTPTLYPWYFAPAPALAALLPQPVPLVWTVLLPVTYWGGSHWYGLTVDALVHLPAWFALFYLLWRKAGIAPNAKSQGAAHERGCRKSPNDPNGVT